MLRVITHQLGLTWRLELHGMLGGEWVPLLGQLWLSILNDAPSASVTVVLSDVEFIDPDGEQLLRRMAESGVDFVVSGCLNRYVIERLHANATARNERRAQTSTPGMQAKGA